MADTSVWIEFLRGKTEIRAILKSEMERGDVVAVECVFGELMQGTRNEDERARLRGYWDSLPRRVESGLWIEAGPVSACGGFFRKGVGLIDAFIIAFARRHGLKVWSLDRKLLSLLNAGEIYVPGG